MPTRKVVQRVVSAPDPLSDFVAIIDVVELQLAIGTDQPSLSERLGALLADIRSGRAIGEGHAGVLADAIDRLRSVETLLADFWRDGPPLEQTSP